VKGRKLHALIDLEGLPLRVIVHSAGIQDRDGIAHKKAGRKATAQFPFPYETGR
jgi:hypothetical protein